MFHFRIRTPLRFLFLFANLLILPLLVSRVEAADVPAGKTVKLTASGAGTGSLVYKWYKNNVFLAERLLDPTYTITNFQAANAGSYHVKISNLLGSSTSPTVTLNLLTTATAPVITTQPTSKTTTAGSSVTFSVVAKGSPAPTYQWRKNGTAITGATGASFTIAAVSSGHAGTYSVVVTNASGSVTSSGAALSLYVAPVITTQPANKTAVAGGSVTFSVVATGSPAPTYQWLKNGSTITGATGSSYTLSNISATDVASYSVRVSNAGGSVRSGNAELTVTAPAPAPTTVHADFNQDGGTDILWQNILTGDHTLWLMSGTSVESGVSLPRKTTDWEVIGVSDFNGDARNDILWQNLVTRESLVWLMNGTTMSSSVSLGVAASGMLMVGTGDFNGDRMPDILWRNTSTGSYSVRFMNRTTPGTSAVIGTGAAGWSVGGTGDFNGDGKTDILWQRVSDGAARVWIMNGATYASTTELGAMGAGWTLGGTGDFNSDGKRDILWQHTVTGVRKVVLMSRLVKMSEVNLGTVPVEWIMVN